MAEFLSVCSSTPNIQRWADTLPARWRRSAGAWSTSYGRDVLGMEEVNARTEMEEIWHPSVTGSFPDNHTSVDYRMDESLPFLAHALTG